ncbi:MAG: hypothetical protein DRO92_02755 [Candidatus Altiarchaeales archaeon]|nr:MAG: hypothetical protein DRO92_02755 [Candidatus Altiarchaeales archaeon]
MSLCNSQKSKRLNSLVNLKPSSIGLNICKYLEWIIPNGTGGYSSSTIINMNTALYHGLLVSSDKNLNKKVFLQKLDEEIITENESISVATDIYEGNNISDGWRYLHNFDFTFNSVFFDYSVEGVDICKSIIPIHCRNAVIVCYTVNNRLDKDIIFRITPYMNIRNVNETGKKSLNDMIPRIFSENITGIYSSNGYLVIYSDIAKCYKIPKEKRWRRIVLYPEDNSIEYLCSPVYFSIDIEPHEILKFNTIAIGYGTEEKTAKVFKELFYKSKEYVGSSRFISSGKGASIMSLLNSVDNFIINVNSKKTIISRYPYSEDKGREAMISLPGFTLINNRYRDAELILEHYLNHADYRGIPSIFRDGKPEYFDIDTSLWLIDRFYKYVKCVGEEKAKGILHTYWWTLKSIINNYIEREKDGLLRHKGGTWMDIPQIKKKRVDAVEVQGLWYNTLRIMEKFREIMGDDYEDVEYSHIYKRFEDNFMDRYWTGSFLADSANDDALRPNQLILISLDFNVVNKTLSKKILTAVKRELLTNYGLRSLTPEDDRYVGKWDNDIKNKFNGNVFPWLLGAYIDAYVKTYGYTKRLQNFLEPLFELHIKDAAIGTISEMFQGDHPNRPVGSISYSCSIAELLRVHFEHVMGNFTLTSPKISNNK